MRWRLPLLFLILFPGCGGLSGTSLTAAGDTRLTEAQACAIGYDLAREMHGRVSIGRTVLVAPKRMSSCEGHALEYLRRAGFRIDGAGLGGTEFCIRVTGIDRETVSAVAEIGGDLRIARPYLPVRTGVVPVGPVSVQRLSPDTHSTREGFR